MTKFELTCTFIDAYEADRFIRFISKKNLIIHRCMNYLMGYEKIEITVVSNSSSELCSISNFLHTDSMSEVTL